MVGVHEVGKPIRFQEEAAHKILELQGVWLLETGRIKEVQLKLLQLNPLV